VVRTLRALCLAVLEVVTLIGNHDLELLDLQLFLNARHEVVGDDVDGREVTLSRAVDHVDQRRVFGHPAI
jgi:hypothetical protein